MLTAFLIAYYKSINLFGSGHNIDAVSGVPQPWFLRVVVKELIEKANKIAVVCLWAAKLFKGFRLRRFFHEVEPLVVSSLVL